MKHFSALIHNSQIAENGYNLSVSSYVEAEDTRPEIDIRELNERIRRIVAHENELRAEIDAIIAELESDTAMPHQAISSDDSDDSDLSDQSDQSDNPTNEKGGSL